MSIWPSGCASNWTAGAPSDQDERTLRGLAAQLRARKVVVKLFLRHPLHAKLYLLGRDDPIVPLVGYVGSSNLTFSGLAGQGELNIDVLEQDAARKLQDWFNDRWNDAFCVDLTDELADIIDASWARDTPVPPYHVYLKMAWHLSNEARAGLDEFRIPAVFGDRLLPYQEAAVKIAARYLNQRGGVLIGDVVGLGKTLMATAVARIFEDDQGIETLILCPRNLVRMWEDYAADYSLRARVLSISRAITELPTLRRYRLVIVDESHNLRNRESKRFRAIRDYIHDNDSKCILLSATPYNKTYLDLSSQLRLFLDDEQELGIRPDRYIAAIGEAEFARKHQAAPGTLAAFDHSEEPDDWRNLMRPLPRAPHPQLHPAALRRDRAGHRPEVPHPRQWRALVLPRTHAEARPVPGRPERPRRRLRPHVRQARRGGDRETASAALRPRARRVPRRRPRPPAVGRGAAAA